MAVSPIPAGYRSVTPYLVMDGAVRALAFYAAAFGARERLRLEGPGGRIRHAEIEIGDSVLMLGDWPEGDSGDASAPPGGDTPAISLLMYVADADAAYARALAAGATAVRPPETKPYGDRNASVRDPFGHEWHLATRVEDLSLDELRRRKAGIAAP